LGVLFFAELLDHLGELDEQGQPDEMVETLKQIQRELDAGETVKVMLLGSIFGGTGASGIPSISRYLRNRFSRDADRFILSSVLMLPYYDVPPAAVDETLEIVVKSSAFLDKARTALQYYGMEGMIRSSEADTRGLYDALYLLGLPQEAFVTTRIYSTGSQSQENDAHLLEWLAARCTARFFRTGFRGADAHNMDCYYYQWHSHDVSWECFDEEAALYRTAFGGFLKASSLFFAECYPTLRACIRNDDPRLSRTVNYWTAYFHGARRFGAAQRAELEKLIDSLYRLMAFYTNWVWQVLRTLPPTLRPEREIETKSRELYEVYHKLVDAQAECLRCEAGQIEGDEAEGAKTEYRQLKTQLNELLPVAGGYAFLTALQTEKTLRTQRVEAQRTALEELSEHIALMEGEDRHLTDPKTLRQEQSRREAMARALAGMEDRAALVEADIVHAVEKHVGDVPTTLPDDDASHNGLFDPDAINAMHELLLLYGTGAETGDDGQKLRRALWNGLDHIVAQRVPDRVDAARAVAGLGGGNRAGEGPKAAFASFTAALLAAVLEEEEA
ncbi:MAG: hypothetical protein PHY64_13125, partial [Eubacteriales bacterium]|nr:hypothetical protein [Eubacteriales bacterium]